MMKLGGWPILQGSSWKRFWFRSTHHPTETTRVQQQYPLRYGHVNGREELDRIRYRSKPIEDAAFDDDFVSLSSLDRVTWA